MGPERRQPRHPVPRDAAQGGEFARLGVCMEDLDLGADLVLDLLAAGQLRPRRAAATRQGARGLLTGCAVFETGVEHQAGGLGRDLGGQGGGGRHLQKGSRGRRMDEAE